MDDSLEIKLRFDHVRAALAGCCASSLGRQVVERLQPARKASVIRKWFEQVDQLHAAADAIGFPPFGGITDIRPLLASAGTPAGLEAEQLKQVSDALTGAVNILAWSQRLGDDHPLIRGVTERIADLGPVARSIDRAIDERAKVRDEASSKLSGIRRSIETASDRLDHIFERLVKQPRITRYLQYAGATFHDHRRVLPVIAEQRGQIRGIVHRTSDSGATLFIEPAEAVELNNSILSLRESERREVDEILSKLSAMVHKNEVAILSSLDAMAVLDLIGSKVRYAQTRAAICPRISEDQSLMLTGARHPVLVDLAAEGQGRTVVPIDVRLGSDFDILIVTGPNTGGKTVALKTVGLLAMMTQTGIPIPADTGATMPVYRRIFIDVGDEQSIEQSLSTFSSHLATILNVLKQADEQSLVLLDELGAGTDPDEGAAIGQAVIEELLARKATAIVTTHLSALKAIAFTRSRADNASVEFDQVSLKPTYRLLIGEPGNSNALLIAKRLGMPSRLIQTARSYLKGRNRQLQKAIAGTLESRRDAERARLSANQTILESEQQRIHFEKQRQLLSEELARQKDWFEWLMRVQPGDEVRVRKFDCTAKVVRLHLQRQTAVVTSGAVEMEVSVGELQQVAKPTTKR